MPSLGTDPIDEDSIPVNLGAVRADDEFIDALLTKPVVPAQTPVDYELAALLSNWRSDIMAEPMPAGPTLEEVEAGIEAQRRVASRRRSLRLVKFTAGAAAGFAILFGGVSVVAHNAAPGDPLWGVKEVMFGADASATLAVADVQANIDRAAQSLAAGDKPAASTFLDRAQSQLGDVRSEDERKALQAKIDEVRGKLAVPAVTTTTSEKPTTRSSTPPQTSVAEVPTVTVTVPQETVTITPPETSATSEPPVSTSPSGPTIVSEPPTEPNPSSSSSSVPLPPPPPA
ncbi:anti-sigma-D factor RsdA-like protein [Williamsia limnetica]|uniref:Anti-sigma-D factor RsdA-like protein n=1 Tax=Williamsia limnetica TaxID=882452 RepID=A0A318RG20_WILLI|nr:anti-sigma-D factor RsdA [Williamsia limnetica]PYE14613.1 anti-sigma-D factor RsdA-like protein [Williamsia limnetica]